MSKGKTRARELLDIIRDCEEPTPPHYGRVGPCCSPEQHIEQAINTACREALNDACRIMVIEDTVKGVAREISKLMESYADAKEGAGE